MAPESESRFGQTMGDTEWRAQERVEVANVERFEDEVVVPLKREAISPEAFVAAGAVRRAVLDDDEARVKKIKESPEYVKSNDYEAKILEFVLQKMFDIGVFGDTVKYTIKTAEPDDLCRGIDFIIDIGEEDERVLLGVDATVSRDVSVLADKVERNFTAAADGRLPAVRYYMDIDGNFKAEKAMPRVIIGVDRETTIRLRDAILEDPASLEDDEAVKLVIGQMIAQLEFALSIAKPNVRKWFDTALYRLYEMCNEKGLELDDLTQAFRGDLLANPQRLVTSSRPSRGRLQRRSDEGRAAS